MARLLTVLAVLAACNKPPAPAFVQRHVDNDSTKPCLAWVDRHFVYRVDPALSPRTAGDKGRAAVSAAFASWQAVAASCSDFTYTEDAGAPDNLVIWRQTSCASAAPSGDPCFTDGTCDDKYGCWDGDTMTLAVTSLTYSRSNGAIERAEIQLDGLDFLFTNVDSPPCQENAQSTACVASDIQNTLTHELGHVIGLDHTNAPGSTMAPTSPVGETSKRVIDMGTAQGFCTIYPRGAATPSCLTP
jgi:hypothetical protein